MKKSILILLLFITTAGFSQNPTPLDYSFRAKNIANSPGDTWIVSMDPVSKIAHYISRSSLTQNFDGTLVTGNTTTHSAIFTGGGGYSNTIDYTGSTLTNGGSDNATYGIGSWGLYNSSYQLSANTFSGIIETTTTGIPYLVGRLAPSSLLLSESGGGNYVQLMLSNNFDTDVPNSPSILMTRESAHAEFCGKNLFYTNIGLLLPSLWDNFDARTLAVAVKVNGTRYYSDANGEVDLGAIASGGGTVNAVNSNTPDGLGNVSLTQDNIPSGTTNKSYTATEKTKLAGIASGATANSTDATLLARENHTGTQPATTVTEDATHRFFTDTERTKLTGIATGATANSTDATLLARVNHTGTQLASTISDFATAVAATSAVSNNTSNISSNTTAIGTKFPLAGGDITGTGGAGYIGLIPQTTAPSTPATGVRVYARTTGAFSWKGTNGFERSFIGTGMTADRTYTLPDADVTLAGLDNTATFTNKTIAAGSNTITGLANTNIASGAAIDAAKINTGVVSNAEYNQLDGVTSPIQTQINNNTTSIATKQTDFFTTQQHLNLPMFNGATIHNTEGTAYVASLNTARTYSTSTYGRVQKVGLVTSTTVGNTQSLRQVGGYFSSTTNYDCYLKFASAELATTSGVRAFVGISALTATPTNVDQTTEVNTLGFVRLSTSNNWNIIYNDGSGTATTIDLGASFPANTTSTDIYLGRIRTVPTGIEFTITNTITAATYTTTVTSDIPASSTLLCLRWWISNNTVGSAVGLDFMGSYLTVN